MTVGFDNPAFDVTMVIFGAIFLFLWLTGGDIKMIGINFPPVTGGFRGMAGLLGVILVALGFVAFSSTSQPAIIPQTPIPDVSSQTSTSKEPFDSQTDVAGWVDPIDNLPTNYNCPYRADGIWLQFPGVQYGPFWDSTGVAYSIAYDQQFIYVSDSIRGHIGTFGDPGLSAQRNQWLPLRGTPFLVCVDTIGSVFAVYQPEAVSRNP